MTEEFKTKFCELKVTGQRAFIPSKDKTEKDSILITFLIEQMKNLTDFEDKGFCYWNISDNYALLRDGENLYRNHLEFYDFIKAYDTKYLWWLVCDATQRFTLEINGYKDFWWNIYKEAVRVSQFEDSIFAEFCAHRAALSINPIMSHSKDNLTFALSEFEQFLNRTEQTPEHEFYSIIYESQRLPFFQYDNKNLLCLVNKLKANLSLAKETEGLIGEWNSFTTPFSKRKQADVGIISAINCMIRCGDTCTAQIIYNDCLKLGLSKNKYIEKRLNIK